MPYRVVRSPGLAAHPFRVLRPQQTKPPGLGGGNRAGSFDLGGGGYSPTGGPGGPASVGDLLGMLGVAAPPRAGGIDESGMPYSSFYNPVAGGTLAGAMLSRSGAGRALQGLISSHYGGGFGTQSWGQMWGPGGFLAGRGPAEQWASDPGRTGPVVHPASVSEIGNLLAHGAASWHSFFKSMTTPKGTPGTTPMLVPKKLLHTRYLDLFGPKPIADWDPYQWVESAGAGSASGYYPTLGPQRGHLSPQEVAAALHQLLRQQKWGSDAAWWGGQWAQSPRASASGSGGGGGTSMAPQTLLGGRRHPYDWVALGGTW
jgi:hypothetical protein